MSCTSEAAPPVLQTVTATTSYPELIVRILMALFGCRENGGKGLEMKFCVLIFNVWFPGKWNTRRESVKVLCDTQLSCFFRYWELNKREWCDVNFVSVTLFFFRFSASKRKQVLPFSEGPTKGNGKEVHFLKKLKTSSH